MAWSGGEQPDQAAKFKFADRFLAIQMVPGIESESKPLSGPGDFSRSMWGHQAAPLPLRRPAPSATGRRSFRGDRRCRIHGMWRSLEIDDLLFAGTPVRIPGEASGQSTKPTLMIRTWAAFEDNVLAAVPPPGGLNEEVMVE